MAFKYLMGAAALLATSLSTSAAELPIRAPKYPIKAPFYKAAPLLANWSGFYVGGNAGYGWGASSVNVVGDANTLSNLVVSDGLPSSLKTSPKGFLGGAQLGYNWQRSQWVYGLEADFDLAAIKGSETQTASHPFTGGSTITNRITGEQKLDTFTTARGRIGYTIQDSLLLYATGGLAAGRARLSYTLETSIDGSPLPTLWSASSKWLVGWTAGAGVEYALNHHWSVKTEYLYYDLGKAETSFAFAGGLATIEAPFRGNIVRVGLNYKF